jgi:hypothetical protein
LAVGAKATGAPEFSKQIEQQQDAAESCFGGKKLLQAKIIGAYIVFQFGDAIFRKAIVVLPEFFRRSARLANEDAEARNLQQSSSPRVALGA